MQINSIDNTSFSGVRVRFSQHTPKSKPYDYMYFMNKSPLAKDYVETKKSNSVVSFFKQMVETLKEINAATKVEK